MKTLVPTSKQLDRLLLEGVEDLSVVGSDEAFARQSLVVLAALVPAESYTFNLINLQRGEVKAWGHPVIEEFEHYRDAFAQHMEDHPVLHSYLADHAQGVGTIRERISAREFRQTGLYAECYRYLRYEDHLAFSLSGDTQSFAAIGLGRSRPFLKWEKAILERFRRHLKILWTRLMWRRECSGLRGILEVQADGMIWIGPDFRVLAHSGLASDWWWHWFGERLEVGVCLPVELRARCRPSWTATDSGEGVVSRKGFALAVIPAEAPAAWVGMIRRVACLVSSSGLRGLSPREVEVLRWVVEGKTNGEIAIILRMSQNTVRNHLAHILKKMGVESRTAAAMVAVEHGFRRG